ncbi:hypothetical protein ACH5A0_36710, partial [Kitasatospora sp. NPDC018614]
MPERGTGVPGTTASGRAEPDTTDAPAHASAPVPPVAPDPVRDPWRDAMRLALAEAGRAVGGGDVPVGAVVLSADGRTV